MSLADFFIGKPGPGSVAEALHFNLPVIVECNARTMPQERYNAEWIRENDAGIVLKSFDEIDSAVKELLSGSVLDRLRTNVATHKNGAVYEAVEILERLMEGEQTSVVEHASREFVSR
jgi:1,2-diacylglycerol 3-beta-galactosyltransferase